MESAVINSIINTLIETVNIGDVVHNVHFGHISDAPQPSYPTITIERFGLGFEDKGLPYQDFDLKISVFSDVSHDECFTIHQAIKGVLHQQRWTTGNTYWLSYRMSAPVDDSERVERTIYFQHAVYTISLLG